MITIKDIAKKAGVAVSTVSYIINNTKHVKPETRERVMAAVQELNYTPRTAAIALKTKKTLTVGIIIPEISNPFYTEIIRGIEETTYANGYNIVLCCTQENEEKEIKYLNDLISKDIDGLIFISTGKNRNILKNHNNIPIIAVDRDVGDFTSTVHVDNVKGGFLATEYLIQKSNHEVHLLTGYMSINTSFERALGYRKAIQQYGLRYDEKHVHECGMNFQAAMETIDILLDKGEKITSLFAASDILALGALKSFMKRGFTVGKDVLLVGYDDVDIAQYVTPALTTIRQPQFKMGRMAAEIIIKQIKENTPVEKIVIDPELVIRGTA